MINIQKAVIRTLFKLPPKILQGMSGGRILIDGRELHHQPQVMLFFLNLIQKKSIMSMTPDQFREQTNGAMRCVEGEKLAMKELWDKEIPGKDGTIPIRIYVPQNASDALLIYFHGGGFVVGDLDSHDAICRFLAHGSSVKVMAVGYRLAPEHKFPAAINDAQSTFLWSLDHAEDLGVDPKRIALGGDSSGANLATVVSQLTLAQGDCIMPAFQLMLYPVVDVSKKRPSYHLFSKGFGLTEEHCDWGVDHYLNHDSERNDPRVSPLLAENLKGLPPTYIATAGFDVLHDEGREYAQRLKDAGVPVEYICHKNLMHGFGRFVFLMDPAREAVEHAAHALRRQLC